MVRLRIAASGELYRDGERISRTAVVDDLLAYPDVSKVHIVVDGNPAVTVRTVVELQNELGKEIPSHGPFTYIVDRDSDDLSSGSDALIIRSDANQKD